ncbi:MAG: class I SAM-dependent methyltransferase [Deltaproteobacteria bacterium]|nr:class I SAM-dependent methyltransferase [Deltaproteobacteria bacterium]
MSGYYSNKLKTLNDLFASSEIRLETDRLIVDRKSYPIVDDVIILLSADQYPDLLKKKLGLNKKKDPVYGNTAARDIQFSFGKEWQKYSDILPEHEEEFNRYFDLIDLESLGNLRVCDLGCGNGRWSYFLKNRCRELILIDFSDSIFVARNNLRDWDGCLFFMGDLTQLPFRQDFADFLFCLGVLHHLPANCLETIRNIRTYAPIFLIYLYYSLDNRPLYFWVLLKIITLFRWTVSKIKNRYFRSGFTWLVGALLYKPLVWTGELFEQWGASKYIPLYESYRGKSSRRIRQDVYDRFFTTIEQRCSRKEIMRLKDTFREVEISPQIPYWHFVCRR